MILQARRLVIVVLLLVALCVGTSHAGVVARAAKAGGGTDYNTGETITAAEVNTDFNTLYTLQDGNIDTNNLDAAAGLVSGQIANDTLVNADVNSAADIAVSKLSQTEGLLDADIVGDYSTNADEQDNTSSPGTADAPTLALHLETEIEQLRYKL